MMALYLVRVVVCYGFVFGTTEGDLGSFSLLQVDRGKMQRGDTNY
jgi:hypothetical protein